MKFLLPFLSALLSATASANPSEIELPEVIDPSAKYVFYSHGFIVEGDNPKPVHQRFGTYDFPAIKQALADESYTLIAQHRAANIAPHLHRDALVSAVGRLLDAGVAARNITLVGFSRGGALTIMASDKLKNAQMNYVILAGCAGLVKRHADLQLFGNVLSIYETSDSVGSCDFVQARSPAISSFSEIAISTGKEHGAFYLPQEQWLSPVKEWLKSR